MALPFFAPSPPFSRPRPFTPRTTFTVEGKALDSYLADVDTDPNYTPDTEVIENGYFNESAKRSAPYFDLKIDGITLLDTAF